MAYDRIIAPTVYRHPIDQMLCSLKYAGRLQWARTAAGLIDVVTSCSTVAELATALKAAQASEVNVWACARTPV